MIRIFFTSLFLLGFSQLFAQINNTPEVPKNYKPTPKELLPMPAALTEKDYYPIMGKYTLVDKDEKNYEINIIPDATNKGVIWVTGLPCGNFKALLRTNNDTYKIPTQSSAVLQIDELQIDSTSIEKVTSSIKSNKIINEGTLIYNAELNNISINIGGKYNEEDPSSVFNNTVSLVGASTKSKKKKKAIRSISYMGHKIVE